MMISRHFSIEEAEKSQVALRRGIDNDIPEHLLDNVIAVAENILEPVREKYGIPFSPSSFYRSPELCIAIGSSRKSQHAKGEAVDFEIPGISNMIVASWIQKNLIFDQLILEYYQNNIPNSGWIHVSYKRNGGNRKEVLVYDGKKYKRGLSANDAG